MLLAEKRFHSEMDNAAFLRALFHGIKEGCSATLHSFPGDPGANPSWVAIPWRPGSNTHKLVIANNNYVCVSSFVRSGDGRYYRRKILFSALHALMIDDLGTKLPMSDLRLKPSALIETSPGNFQAWLILDKPISEITTAEAVIDSMIAQGITAQADPGMKGVTRVARLPIGSNCKPKYGKPFIHRVAESNLGTRYSISDIVSAYSLNIIEKARDTDRPAPRLGVSPDRAALLQFIKIFGHYQYQVRDQYHAILCPFWEDHTDRGTTGTYFMEPGPGNSWVGGFTCNHGHCSERDINDLVAWVEVMKDIARSSGG